MNKFKEKLNKVAIPAMNKKFGYKNAFGGAENNKSCCKRRHRFVQRRSQKRSGLEIFHPNCRPKAVGQQSQEVNSFLRVEGKGCLSAIRRH